MSGGLAPYPEYGSDTVQLLGNFPKGWTATPIKVIGELGGGAGFPHDEQGRSDYEIEFHKVNSLGTADAQDFLRSSENTISKETAQRLRARIFPEQTIVFAKVGAALLLSRFRRLQRPACLDNNMMGLEVRKVHCPGFVNYALGVLPMSYVVNPGAVPSVNEGGVGNLRLPLPPLDEQTQIAKFLDYETAKIDQLIDKQQQLIALLEEKRQAVISHAVTKGLNPNAPMKDSGVEWLGQVPAHWTVGRYKFCTTRVVVGIAEAATHAYADTGVPIIRSTNIREGGLSVAGLLHIKHWFANQNDSKFLYTDDIVTVRTGYPGVSAVVPEALNRSQCFTNLVATPKNTCSPRFLCEFLNSHFGRKHFELLGWGSAQKNISVPILQNVPVVWPPKAEQQEIAAYVDQQRTKFSALTSKAESMVAVLHERRTALISAAVTGKIDVRNWQPPEGEATQEVA